MLTIRPCTAADYPAISVIHNSLEIIWPERPRTPAGWEEIDRQRDQRNVFRRLVAEQNGHVIGFGSYAEDKFIFLPKCFNINVEVSPDYQRKGAGTALYEAIMNGMQPYEPRYLRADAFTNLPQGFPFLQKRGFFEAFRETPVHLDITAFDPSPYSGLEPKLAAQGIVIKTLREMELDPERDRKLYELYVEAEADVPSEGSPANKPPFEEWINWGIKDPNLVPDAYFIAIKGQEYIGLRELYQLPENDALLGGLLGVKRVYRKRGVGLAMQLRGIAYARAHGCPVLKTCTAVQNAPMQALFNKLGYARDPEWLQCQKDL